MQDVYQYALFSAGIIEAIDLMGVATRWETYGKIKSSASNIISSDTFQSINKYLRNDPYYFLDRLPKKLPLTYLLERKMKSMLKGKITEYGKNILDTLNKPSQKIRDDDILVRNKEVSIKNAF